MLADSSTWPTARTRYNHKAMGFYAFLFKQKEERSPNSQASDRAIFNIYIILLLHKSNSR